ncbi:pesticidal protein Cry5Aa [Neisseria dumasiana]|uniref:Pesticidal protein Cry5Aa n=1 Tax=Neisseria dumasiana TaxID=1931275 RepID=A0A1X3DJ91_9NEIS|nr:pesticidal protein Cry5Aa [Neisseria dumasiana]OSI23524.1 pesticidal protein Cry5Aa [Neisseria dumasiana]
MKMLLGIGVVWALVLVAYFNRDSNIAPAIMMILVFPAALFAVACSGRRRDWYDD